MGTLFPQASVPGGIVGVGASRGGSWPVGARQVVVIGFVVEVLVLLVARGGPASGDAGTGCRCTDSDDVAW